MIVITVDKPRNASCLACSAPGEYLGSSGLGAVVAMMLSDQDQCLRHKVKDNLGKNERIWHRRGNKPGIHGPYPWLSISVTLGPKSLISDSNHRSPKTQCPEYTALLCVKRFGDLEAGITNTANPLEATNPDCRLA